MSVILFLVVWRKLSHQQLLLLTLAVLSDEFPPLLVESTTIKDNTHFFAPGDNVEVTEGELVNLRGKIVSVDGPKVVMMPDHEELKV